MYADAGLVTAMRPSSPAELAPESCEDLERFDLGNFRWAYGREYEKTIPMIPLAEEAVVR